ncbi:MAG: NADH-quinone oxidoreductase subunit M [Armatimonadetes bacterium]|nr:NADH-quinone oxidoreductase subunit M [Armatimonadota bacterium]
MPDIDYISWITFLPLAGALVILLMPRRAEEDVRWTALGISFAVFILSLPLYFRFDTAESGMQFQKDLLWIPDFNIRYHVGIDGISLLLVMLTTFLTPLAIWASWPVRQKVREYMAFMLLLETGMIGVFVALDLFLFYIFWEAMLIPMYFLIGIWGGQRRVYAAVKFILYTMVGSLLMLVAILYLYLMQPVGDRSYDLLAIRDFLAANPLAPGTQALLFLAFGLAFAIKVPMFPFHTWLPDAHVEAPTAGSVLLAGVLLKMGTYGFLRFCLPLFPDASLMFTPLICTLAVIGIVYGALVAAVQTDIKKLVAYSSVSHLGFVMLGMFAFNQIGMQGSLLQMVNHGLSTGALFLIVGMIYDRRHTREIDQFGGLAKQMPAFWFFFMIATLASIGLPSLNGFIGEFLIMQGSFLANFGRGAGPMLYPVLAASGVVLAAIYMLWMFRRVMHGPLDHPENRSLPDLNLRERLILIPISLMMLFIGIQPNHFLKPMEPSVKAVLSAYENRPQVAQSRPQVVDVIARSGATKQSPGYRIPR